MIRSLCISLVFLMVIPVAALANGKPGAKPKPSKPAAKSKPKPKPHPSQTHKPTPSHAHSTPHRVHHNFYAGRAARSQAWHHHHRHWRWTYEVRVRSRAWHERAFGSQGAARTFSRYVHLHHFERHTYHPTEGVWIVAYRNPHSRHFGTYAALPVARRVEYALRQSGFSAWLHWHRRYFF
jgi:hypothetical protein